MKENQTKDSDMGKQQISINLHSAADDINSMIREKIIDDHEKIKKEVKTKVENKLKEIAESRKPKITYISVLKELLTKYDPVSEKDLIIKKMDEALPDITLEKIQSRYNPAVQYIKEKK